MLWQRYVLPLLLAEIAFSSAMIAQTAAGTPPLRTPGGSGPGSVIIPGSGIPGTRTASGGTNRREPCWQVAGVSKSAMEQRRVLSMQTRQEVEAVCADAALSAAQKQVRIREIHQQERQRIDGLISPAQREAMHACQQQRGGSGAGGGNLGGGLGEGPCGGRSAVAKRLIPPASSEAIPKD
jgi:hypothetical protein